MEFDPLELFVHEKTGSVQKLLDDANKPRPVTHDINRNSLDPGARALAGISAVSGSVINRFVAPAVNIALASTGMSEAVRFPRIVPTTNKLMGLFNIKSPAISHTSSEASKFAPTFLDALPSVMSFFESHPELDREGATINLTGEGVLSKLRGPRYNVLHKKVHLPYFSKELALHELGHALDFTGSKIGKIRAIAGPIVKNSLMMALPIALVAGDKIKEALPGTIDDKAIGFMQRHAPEIAGATIASTVLYPEAKAWITALRHIKKTEGTAAMRKALSTAIPSFSTYALSAIPVLVGYALARKFMRDARNDRAKLQQDAAKMTKNAGTTQMIIDDIVATGRELSQRLIDVGRQAGEQSIKIIKAPGTIKKVVSAAKEVGTSPEFVAGTMFTALPAAMGSLYLYGSPAGKKIRERIAPEHIHKFVPRLKKKTPPTDHEEAWREKHPLRFAGLVALGAALSTGVMNKFMADLSTVL